MVSVLFSVTVESLKEQDQAKSFHYLTIYWLKTKSVAMFHVAVY